MMENTSFYSFWLLCVITSHETNYIKKIIIKKENTTCCALSKDCTITKLGATRYAIKPSKSDGHKAIQL